MTREQLEKEVGRLRGVIARNQERFLAVQEGARAWRREALQLRIIALRQKAQLHRSVGLPELGAPLEVDN